IQGRAGVSVYNKSPWTTPLGVSGGMIPVRWQNAWTPNNRNTNIPELKFDDYWNNRSSSFWVVNLWFVKVKNIQLSYTLPDIMGITNINIYVDLQNYLTFVPKDYEGFDPERSTFKTGYRDYPLPKTISIGMNIQF